MKTPRAVVFFLLCLALVACTERRQSRLLDQAEAQLSDGKPAEAAELYRKVITLDVDSKPATKAYYRLGFAQETYLKDYEGAIGSYQEFLKLSQDPVSHYEVQKRLANIFFQHLLDSEKAVEAYRKLLLANPDTLEADQFLFRIAQAFFRMNKFDEARKEFQNLLERYPKSQFSAKARYSIGNTYFMQGSYTVAMEALKQVLRLHPNSDDAVEAQYLMAQCLEHDGKIQNAAEMYLSLKERYPVPEVIELRLAEIQKRNKAPKPEPKQ
jgi:TolA-binding protein